MGSRVAKSQWGGVRYFMVRAYPLASSKNSKYGGAYVSCWVNYPHEEGALVLAKHYIRGAGWQWRNVLERRWVSRSDYARNESLQYYDEAAKDGSSFVFDTYPKRRRKQSNQLLKQRRAERRRAV